MAFSLEAHQKSQQEDKFLHTKGLSIGVHPTDIYLHEQYGKQFSRVDKSFKGQALGKQDAAIREEKIMSLFSGTIKYPNHQDEAGMESSKRWATNTTLVERRIGLASNSSHYMSDDSEFGIYNNLQTMMMKGLNGRNRQEPGLTSEAQVSPSPRPDDTPGMQIRELLSSGRKPKAILQIFG